MNNFVSVDIMDGHSISWRMCVDIKFSRTYIFPSIVMPLSHLSDAHGGSEGNNYFFQIT